MFRAYKQLLPYFIVQQKVIAYYLVASSSNGAFRTCGVVELNAGNGACFVRLESACCLHTAKACDGFKINRHA